MISDINEWLYFSIEIGLGKLWGHYFGLDGRRGILTETHISGDNVRLQQVHGCRGNMGNGDHGSCAEGALSVPLMDLQHCCMF